MKTQFTLVLAMAAAPSLTLAAGYGASPDRSPPGASFESVDSDGDGKISRPEAKKYPELYKRFGQYDKEKSGTLSRAEFEQYAVDQDPGLPSTGGSATPIPGSSGSRSGGSTYGGSGPEG